MCRNFNVEENLCDDLFASEVPVDVEGVSVSTDVEGLGEGSSTGVGDAVDARTVTGILAGVESLHIMYQSRKAVGRMVS